MNGLFLLAASDLWDHIAAKGYVVHWAIAQSVNANVGNIAMVVHESLLSEPVLQGTDFVSTKTKHLEIMAQVNALTILIERKLLKTGMTISFRERINKIRFIRLQI
jgi:hypothetical protein